MCGFPTGAIVVLMSASWDQRGMIMMLNKFTRVCAGCVTNFAFIRECRALSQYVTFVVVDVRFSLPTGRVVQDLQLRKALGSPVNRDQANSRGMKVLKRIQGESSLFETTEGTTHHWNAISPSGYPKSVFQIVRSVFCMHVRSRAPREC